MTRICSDDEDLPWALLFMWNFGLEKHVHEQNKCLVVGGMVIFMIVMYLV